MSSAGDEGQLSEGERGIPSLPSLYKQLLKYKSNLYKISALLSLPASSGTTSASEAQLASLKNSINQAIAYYEEAIALAENEGDETLSRDMLSKEHQGRVALAWFQKDNRWYHAEVEKVDVDAQETEVKWVGYGIQEKISAIYVKVLKMPDPAKLLQGAFCDAINPKDGKWQGAIIEKISDAGYHIKFRKSLNKETVSIYYLREARQHAPKAVEARTMAEFAIPEALKPLPSDSAEEREKKRKKLKHLKQRHKNNIIERDLQVKKGSWKNFNDQSKLKKMGHFMIKKNTDSIFKTPDTVHGRVGVMNSGRGMTDYRDKEKFMFDAAEAKKKLKTE